MGQGVEALAKQITGHARHASVDVGEAQGAGQQLPQNQGCPALCENLRGKCYGTKLAIPLHAVQHDRIVVPPQVQFLNYLSPLARQEEIFDGLARNPPPQFRAEGGRVAKMHPTVDSGVIKISEHLAETVVGPDGLE